MPISAPRHIVLWLLILVMMAQCATYERRMVKDVKANLIEDSLHVFDKRVASKSYKQSVWKDSFKLESRDLLCMLNRASSTACDSSICSSYRVRFISADTLLVESLNDRDSVIANQSFAGRLRHGFFYLDNKRVKYNGVPYLFGGSQSDKTRVGISKENDFLVQSAYDKSGAFLLLIGVGYSYNEVTYFKSVPSP